MSEEEKPSGERCERRVLLLLQREREVSKTDAHRRGRETYMIVAETTKKTVPPRLRMKFLVDVTTDISERDTADCAATKVDCNVWP